MRSLIAINVLDAFIHGVYMWTIPLLLVERNISLTGVGVVFSIYAISFAVTRLLFASVAESVGLKRIFQFNALGSLASVVLYTSSSSYFSYSAGKAAQAIKDSSLWAVNRNAAYQIARNVNPQMAVAMILFIRALAVCLGAIVSSILLAHIGFEGLFAFIAILSVLMFVPASRLDVSLQRSGLKVNELFRRLDPRLMPQRLWWISLVMSCSSVASTLITSYILPIFLRSRGLSYWEIGLIFAMYTGVGALLIPLTLRGTASARNVIIIQIALYLPAAILIPVYGPRVEILLIMMMALGEYIAVITWESLIHEAVKESKNVATAIALVHLPSNLVIMPIFVFAGFLTETVGYHAPFWTAAASFLVYSITAWHFLKSPRIS